MPSEPIRSGALARLAPAPVAVPARRDSELLLFEYAIPGQIGLRGDAFDPRFGDACRAALGSALPVAANTVTVDAALAVLWLGPDEWLVVTPPGQETALLEALERSLSGLHAAATDVTGNRARLRLVGPGARQTLMKGCSLDLHPRRFGPGRCAQTSLARAQILLYQLDDTPCYDLFVRRSFAEYVWAWLDDAMAEYGGRSITQE
jgi:sarcosine oxidase subunit gamma